MARPVQYQNSISTGQSLVSTTHFTLVRIYQFKLNKESIYPLADELQTFRRAQVSQDHHLLIAKLEVLKDAVSWIISTSYSMLLQKLSHGVQIGLLVRIQCTFVTRRYTKWLSLWTKIDASAVFTVGMTFPIEFKWTLPSTKCFTKILVNSEVFGCKNH